MSVRAGTQKGVDIELYKKMLTVALEEAQQGHAEGGIPIGAALFTRSGQLLSRGHNRRVQDGAMLVLQRSGAAIPDRDTRGGRQPHVCGRTGLVAREWR